MKKFIKFAFVAAVVDVSGYNVYQSQSVMNGMSDFALANVEALAQSESSEEFTNSTCCVATWDNVSCKGCNDKTYSFAYRI